MKRCPLANMPAPSRRQFLKSVGAGALSLGAVHWPSPLLAGGSPRYPGRVVEVFDDDGLSAGKVVQPVVDKMLARGMLELTGAEDLTKAWQLFVSPNDVIGLKVNALSGPGCSTHREVVNAIIHGLKLAGVEDENIIVWDQPFAESLFCKFVFQPFNKLWTGEGIEFDTAA